jgi:hypothetical protein
MRVLNCYTCLYEDEDADTVKFDIHRNNIKTLFDDVFKHTGVEILERRSNLVWSGFIGPPSNIEKFVKNLLSLGIIRFHIHKGLESYFDEYTQDIYSFLESRMLAKPSVELITNIIGMIVSEI